MIRHAKTRSVLLALLCGLAATGARAEETGDFRTSYVHLPYVIHHVPAWEAAARIERYIRSSFPNREDDRRQIATSEVARQIAVVAKCFEIDAYVFAGLVRAESLSFDQYATSPTGAVGLTQMTSIAIKEIHDQLGARGERNARKEAIDYFRGVLRSSCIENELLAGKAFIPLHERRDGVAAKTALQRDTTASLIYGAILLKTGISVVRQGGATSCDKSGKPKTLTALYRKAVHKYNADPKCATQRWYAAKVMDEYTPAIVRTP